MLSSQAEKSLVRAPRASSSKPRQQLNSTLVDSLRVCDHCRIRKTKCDMKQPACDTCQKRGLSCLYSTKRKKPGPPKGFCVAKKRPRPSQDLEHEVEAVAHTDISSTDARADSSWDWTEMTLLSGQNENVFDVDTSPSDNTEPSPVEEVSSLNLTVPLLDDLELANWVYPTFAYHTNHKEMISTMSSPECTEKSYLYKLYFDYLQPLYPLLSRPQNSHDLNTMDLPPRLEKAVFCVASRFAEAGKVRSPREYARQARNCDIRTERMIDQVKAEFLLCVYSLTEAISPETLAEVGRIVRLANIYGFQYAQPRSSQRSSSAATAINLEVEEWKSLWWSIYTLDICCNALTSTPNTPASCLHMTALPAVSLDDVTDPQSALLCPTVHFPQHLSSSGVKFREVIFAAVQQPSTRSRNSHIAICSFMGAVTDIRSQAMFGRSSRLNELLHDLSSDSAAAKLAIPAWFTQAPRSFATAEPARDHQLRLHALLVWGCADLMLLLAAADDSRDRCPPLHKHWENTWQAISARAHDMVPIVQHCKREYIMSLDPMCSYVVLLVASVLAIDHAMLPPLHPNEPRAWADLDLMELFMRRIGQYWSVGNHAAETFQVVRKYAERNFTCQEAVDSILRMTNRSISFDPCKRFGSISLEPAPTGQRKAVEAPTLVQEVEDISAGLFDLPELDWIHMPS